jgi:hypothetical protein
MLKNANQKSPRIFVCESCDYECSKSSEYNKHKHTAKHINATNANIKISKIPTCDCGKIFKHVSSLSRHKKTCKISASEVVVVVNDNHIIQLLIKENTDFKNIILDVVKNNTELQKQTNDLQKQMLEVCKNNNTIINNSNSHNKTFNLQVFLNEECKDAMNLTDFMNSFQLQLEDLEKVGTMGYVDGVSNIILKKLREMDVNKRPMHCSDAKREIMYIKEEDKWEKEGLNNLKLKKAITIIENKNIKLLGAWKEAHPKYMEYDEPDNDIYTHLIIQTMSNCDDFGNKVIKKLAKEVTIDK